MIELDTALRHVISEKVARGLADHLELRTVGDLLDHLPRRYQERGQLTELSALRPGEVVTVQARVRSAKTRQMRARGRSFVELTVTDDRDVLSVLYFNQAWRAKQLAVGTVAAFAGTVEAYGQRLQLVNPEFEILSAADGAAGTAGEGVEGVEGAAFAEALVPIYPATEQLNSWKIGRSIRVLLDCLGELADPLPADLRARHRLVDLTTAYELVHRPSSYADVARGRLRLRWDEALTLQVILARRRREISALATAARRPAPGGLLPAFDASLPFALTEGQRAVGAIIQAELAQPVPMHRLLQGEVGSGKTIVALRAMLAVVDAGGQAVLLAPTETLAAQHHRSLRDLLGGLGRAGELDAAERATRVALLTGSLGARARRAALAAAADGSAGLIVGTHALLHDAVEFHDLGLIVVDEQHRFGVEQRDALRSRASQPPHVLVMTATPIPRTVAMTVFGDLEVSTLTELPEGRQPISTFVIPAAVAPAWRDRMWGRIRDEAAAGHQAFVVCPRIGGEPGADGRGATDLDGDDLADGLAGPDAGDAAEGTEAGDAAEGGEGTATRAGPDVAGGSGPGPAGSLAGLGVVDLLPRLANGELAGLRVAALHGRLPADVKDAVMTRFAAGEIDVLVATTVIEVGVDVPNATVMVVLDADRFGVSQLHQLRGRVGRGDAPGWCLLHTELEARTPAAERLVNVAATTDGVELARLDLIQRREGDVLGAAQSGGRRSLRLLRLHKDEELIRAARDEATRLVAGDPDLTALPALRRALRAVLDDADVAFLEKG